MTYFDDMNYRLNVVNLLIAVKNTETYRKLEKKTKISQSELSRYVKGHNIPRKERCDKLYRILKDYLDFTDILRGCIQKKDDFLDFCISPLQKNYLFATSRLYLDVFEFTKGLEITKILTAETAGTYWSSMVSYTFKKPLVTLRKVPFEEDDIQETIKRNGDYLTLYTPRKTIERGDNIFFMDAFARKGCTSMLANNLVKKCGARIKAYYFLASIGNEWEPALESIGRPYKILLKY